MRAGKTRRMSKQAPAGLRHFRSFAASRQRGLCFTEALIQSELPYQINRISEGAQMNYSKIST